MARLPFHYVAFLKFLCSRLGMDSGTTVSFSSDSLYTCTSAHSGETRVYFQCRYGRDSVSSESLLMEYIKDKWVFLLLALDILLMRLKDAVLRHRLNPDLYTLLTASQYIHNVSLIITEKAITAVFYHSGSYTPTFNTHMTTQTYDSFGRNKWMFLHIIELLIAERQATRRIR
jgi:hypothetical protein